MSKIDIQIINTRANLTKIKRERQSAQSKQDTTAFAYNKRLSKAERQLANAGKRSRLHLYMAQLRVGKNTPSPYTLQKQAVVCMNLHNLEAMSKQQVLLEGDHQYLVRNLDNAGKDILNEMRVRKKTILHHKSVLEEQIEDLKRKYDEAVIAQEIIIDHLRGNLLANGEEASTIRRGDATENHADINMRMRPSIWSVQGVVVSMQQRRDHIKTTLREKSFPNIGGDVFLNFRRDREDTNPMNKVVAKVA